MSHNDHHEHLVEELAKQLEPVLTNSPQAIYLYLDDEHKICNEKFAEILGYESVAKWVENQTPLSDVDEEDQEKVVKAFMEASGDFKASNFDATLIKKNGEKFEANITMAPITHANEVFVIHFIEEK